MHCVQLSTVHLCCTDLTSAGQVCDPRRITRMYLRPASLDHLRTHEKDRWTLIHINSYIVLLMPRTEYSFLLPTRRCTISRMHLVHLLPPFIPRYIHFVSLYAVARFRYSGERLAAANIFHAEYHRRPRARCFASFRRSRKEKGWFPDVRSVERRGGKLIFVF